MEKREIDLTVSCYGKVKDVKYDVVILPWGATEPHNLHLPYLTDCILPHDIAVDAATLALERSGDRKSTRLNSSHTQKSRMPSSA